MVGDRMIYEFLYNVPPLYHLNKQEWTKNNETIVHYCFLFKGMVPLSSKSYSKTDDRI
ncbi:glycoside hydrolase [Peribacillus simplex]|uniref:glycoside hydrolase n=1 Tax=Peribacillus simplex TaxID=1478 RepID=UPI00399C5FA8